MEGDASESIEDRIISRFIANVQEDDVISEYSKQVLTSLVHLKGFGGRNRIQEEVMNPDPSGDEDAA